MSARNASLPPDTTRISSVTTILKPGPCGVETCQMPPPDGHGVPLSPGRDQGSLPSGTRQRLIRFFPHGVDVSSKLSMNVATAAAKLVSPVCAEGRLHASFASPRAAPVNVTGGDQRNQYGRHRVALRECPPHPKRATLTGRTATFRCHETARRPVTEERTVCGRGIFAARSTTRRWSSDIARDNHTSRQCEVSTGLDE
jgi:hypothetical protein